MRIEKGADGRLKRIEYRGRYLRASRTGGVALRAQTRAAGINLTANTARGTRVSTRLAKGTQAAFQNGRFILRGRYGDGPDKINLSKSGVSVSTKTEIGTVNWFKPRYSSVKIGGVQVRGKNAVYIHLIVGLLQALAYGLLLLAQLAVLLLQGLYWLGVKAWQLARRGHGSYQARRMRPVERRWLQEWTHLDAAVIDAALKLVLLELAAGRSLELEEEASARPSDLEARRKIAVLLDDCTLKPPQDLKLLFACLVEVQSRTAPADKRVERFLELDERVLARGRPTRLQEELLAIYAEVCGIEAV